MTDKTIYLIPGVGANDKIFGNLDLTGYDVVHIKWPKHTRKENIQAYVKKLLPQIKKDTRPILIGMSFGGIVATELAKLIHPEKTILISTIKTYHERPFKIMFMNSVKFHRLIPGKLVINLRFWLRYVLGKLNRHDYELIEDMIQEVDIDFNEWAVDQVIHWKNEEIPDNVVHIHGTHDWIFPKHYIQDCYWIKGGTHFMVVNRAKEINRILRKELSEKKFRIAATKNLRKAS
ncbi:MAG: alpha/beta hydrolase [Chitinophagales bacterium]|nr:alpha/beta hydrolase [Chitinophagales bacterium]